MTLQCEGKSVKCRRQSPNTPAHAGPRRARTPSAGQPERRVLGDHRARPQPREPPRRRRDRRQQPRRRPRQRPRRCALRPDPVPVPRRPRRRARRPADRADRLGGARAAPARRRAAAHPWRIHPRARGPGPRRDAAGRRRRSARRPGRGAAHRRHDVRHRVVRGRERQRDPVGRRRRARRAGDRGERDRAAGAARRPVADRRRSAPPGRPRAAIPAVGAPRPGLHRPRHRRLRLLAGLPERLPARARPRGRRPGVGQLVRCSRRCSAGRDWGCSPTGSRSPCSPTVADRCRACCAHSPEACR